MLICVNVTVCWQQHSYDVSGRTGRSLFFVDTGSEFSRHFCFFFGGGSFKSQSRPLYSDGRESEGDYRMHLDDGIFTSYLCCKGWVFITVDDQWGTLHWIKCSVSTTDLIVPFYTPGQLSNLTDFLSRKQKKNTPKLHLIYSVHDTAQSTPQYYTPLPKWILRTFRDFRSS